MSLYLTSFFFFFFFFLNKLVAALAVLFYSTFCFYSYFCCNYDCVLDFIPFIFKELIVFSLSALLSNSSYVASNSTIQKPQTTLYFLNSFIFSG